MKKELQHYMLGIWMTSMEVLLFKFALSRIKNQTISC